ncbi:MAG: ThiF family adenylyltransferase [Armatimonadetes bacterium]|nr:ThiF family adenylyltransferase [Armatimonadota bacterium]
MKRIVFAGTSYEQLKLKLADTRESCAILLAVPPSADGLSPSFLVRDSYIAQERDYFERSEESASLHPEALVPFLQRARDESLALVFVHTHPGSRSLPEFSVVDDAGEQHLSQVALRRAPDRLHAAIVIGPSGCTARCLGTTEPLRVVQVGRDVGTPSNPDHALLVDSRWSRQVLAFGAAGNRALRRCKVGIVGLGGTGSIVVEELARLGVEQFVLIDHDVVDESNLNRLTTGLDADVGKPKVIVAKNRIGAISEKAQVHVVVDDVTKPSAYRALLDCDALFACTDSHASRMILNVMAYQYFIPLFDLGVSIGARDGLVTHIAGRVQMAAPGLACLVCAGVLDATAVRRELQTEAQRSADPYIMGNTEPQPAVISLNGTIASLAVTMFMGAFAGVPAAARLQYYNGLTGTVRAAELGSDPTCVVCSAAGAFGRGQEWPLPGRAEGS